MYIKNGTTKFAVGYINDEYLITKPEEFTYQDNQLVGVKDFDTWYDDATGLTLYQYNDKLVTYKELVREYLKDYYKVA